MSLGEVHSLVWDSGDCSKRRMSYTRKYLFLIMPMTEISAKNQSSIYLHD